MEPKIKNISFCGLYCGNCPKYKKEKCPGCAGNAKASWCKIRSCCIENNYKSCVECSDPGIESCKKFNNPLGTLFGIIFNSDRASGIRMIQNDGCEAFVMEMNKTNRMTIPRRRKK